MDMTFAEFAKQCQFYHRSQESYDVLRECAEIELMEKYIEDHKFYEEYANEFAGTALAEGYFGESVDSGSLEVLTEKSKLKKYNLMSVILKGFLKLMTGFGKFTGRMAAAFDKTSADAENVVKALNSQVISDAKMTRIRTMVSEALQSCPGFVPHENQPFASKLKFTPMTGTAEKGLVNALAAGLSNSKANAKVGLFNGAQVGALPIDTLRSAAADVVSMNPQKIFGTAQTCMATWAKVSADGLMIPVIPKEIERAKADLEKVCSSIEEGINSVAGGAQVVGAIVKDVNTTIAAKDPDTLADPNKAKRADAINDGADAITGALTKGAEELRKIVNASIGASLSVYSDYSKFRKLIIGGMKTILTDKEPDTATQQPTAQGETQPAAEPTQEPAPGTTVPPGFRSASKPAT